MLTIGLAEAQERLGSLVELAEAGEIVCIMRRGKQVVQITSIGPYVAVPQAAARNGAADHAQLR
jgi:prevent-host-death family protein